MSLLPADIALLRLDSQQVGGTKYKTPAALVARMGAMQAQDYGMARLAVGIRVPRTNSATVQRAIDRGEVIRTHVLRPTWHLVAARDISWMLDLTAPHIKASLTSRHRQLELTPSTISKGCRAIERSLSREDHLTREELVQRLGEAGIKTHDNRAAHILLMAELDKIICSGPLQGKKNTYRLFANCIRDPAKLTREESLAALAGRYLQSHGPATIQDFTWWSGLPARDAKAGIEMVKTNFLSETIGTRTYWFVSPRPSPTRANSLYFLPAFDEFIISYRDRSAGLALTHHARAIGVNGMFRPVIVFNGQVIGTWKRTMVKNKGVISTQLFPRAGVRKNRDLRNMIGETAEKVNAFFTTGQQPDDQ
ncbi:MAG TPA: winged helix DNA-binding domain-containing protein [Chryseosolibacter sp.]